MKIQCSVKMRSGPGENRRLPENPTGLTLKARFQLSPLTLPLSPANGGVKKGTFEKGDVGVKTTYCMYWSTLKRSSAFATRFNNEPLTPDNRAIEASE
jgi:hypothetical protein